MIKDQKLNGGQSKLDQTVAIGGTTRCYSGQINRGFGKDITNNVLN